jgi:hypothetical protein
MADALLRIEFQLTFEEYRDAMKIHAARTRLAITAMVVLASLISLWNFLPADPPVQPPEKHPIIVSLLLWATWLAVFGIIWFCIFRVLGGGVKKAWAGQPNSALPRTVEIREDRVFVVSMLERTEYLWPAFTRFRESRRLFMLYTSTHYLVIIPKRVFTDAAGIDFFRQITSSRIVPRLP